MRVVITDTVPGYKTGTSYSVSDDLACHLVADEKARGETRESHAAILLAIKKRLADISGPTSEWLRFEQEPEADQEIYKKGKNSKSQKRKTKKKAKNK